MSYIIIKCYETYNHIINFNSETETFRIDNFLFLAKGNLQSSDNVPCLAFHHDPIRLFLLS